MKMRHKLLLFTALIFAASQASAMDGLKVLRSFGKVPAFGITNANLLEVDPSFFRFTTVSARRAAGKSKLSVLALRKLLPEPALIINAGFFNPPDGFLIGEFVEDGIRPDGIVYPSGENIDRIFVVRKDGSIDVIEGQDSLTPEELERTAYAVAGKSSWPGHNDATNRTAVCVTGAGKVIFAAVYPVRTLEKLYDYMESEGCIPEKTVSLDGGGSTQMSFNYGGDSWNLGWERKGGAVPECHFAVDNRDPRCYRAVATFITAEPRQPSDRK